MAEQAGREQVKRPQEKAVAGQANSEQAGDEVVSFSAGLLRFGARDGRPNLSRTVDSLATVDTNSRAGMLLQMQRTYGNRYVQRVLAQKRATLPAPRPSSNLMRDPQPESVAPTTTPVREQPGGLNAQIEDKLKSLETDRPGQTFGETKVDVEWEHLSENSRDRNGVHNERPNKADANESVKKIEEIRTLLQQLDEKDFGNRAALDQIKANYYARLRRVSPYYSQMRNMNVLYTEEQDNMLSPADIATLGGEKLVGNVKLNKES